MAKRKFVFDKNRKGQNRLLKLAEFLAIASVLLVAILVYQKVVAFNAYVDSLSRVEGANTNGYDAFGYNRTARIFNGPADGVDKVLDGTVWGDPTYAKDKLVMKWNAEWDRGNAENWAHPPYNAWEDNEWNGMNGGTGTTWHYKIIWNGPCTDGETLPNGGYCIWGQFATIMDKGKDPASGPAAIWIAHAKPTGYGAYKQ